MVSLTSVWQQKQEAWLRPMVWKRKNPPESHCDSPRNDIWGRLGAIFLQLLVMMLSWDAHLLVSNILFSTQTWKSVISSNSRQENEKLRSLKCQTLPLKVTDDACFCTCSLKKPRMFFSLTSHTDFSFGCDLERILGSYQYKNSSSWNTQVTVLLTFLFQPNWKQYHSL